MTPYRHFLMCGSSLSPPLAGMHTRYGLLSSYWKGDHKGQAWLYTLGVAAFTGLISYNGIQAGLQWAEVMGNLASYDTPNAATVSKLASNFGLWFAMTLAQTGLVVTRHLASSTLHRKWRGWLDEQFTNAMLGAKGTVMHLKHNGGKDEIDNIDQRKTECIKDITGSSLGLAMGATGALTSLGFAGYELFKMTKPVQGLEFLGDYGTLTLAFTAAALTVVPGTFAAKKIGKWIKNVNWRMQESEANYRAHTFKFVHNGTSIAASGGHDILQKVNKGLYAKIDDNWRDYNYVHAGFMAFKGVYNPFSGNIVTYMPCLPNLIQGTFTFKDHMAGTGIIKSVFDNMEWIIDVMPALAGADVNIKRLTDLVVAIQTVQNEKDYYESTGTAELQYLHQDKALGLVAQNLEIMHKGPNSEPFLKARHFRVKPGEWACIVGPSGSGKSCLMKALAGGWQWPYGRGKIAHDNEAKVFYAEQNTVFERVSLKQLITHPVLDNQYSDESIKFGLEQVGLGEFKNQINNVENGGKIWDDALSGGQRQKIILARILLQKPDILFLDEATSGLDPVSKMEFHALLKRHLSDTVVVSIIHDPELPRDRTGNHIYKKVLQVEDGQVTQITAFQYERNQIRKAQELQRSIVMKQAGCYYPEITFSLGPQPL